VRPARRLQAQALQAGSRQHDGVVLAFVKLAQAGVEVAAQRLNAQIRTRRAQQGHTAQAGGADHGALRQGRQAGVLRRDKGIARIFALHHAGQRKPFGQVHRHILERVHGQISPPLFQRHFQLLDEQPLAANLAQGAVENLVALGRHAQQRDFVPLLRQQGFDMLGLPQGKTAFSGGNGELHWRVQFGNLSTTHQGMNHDASVSR
jgi:hypothetical protein